MSIKKEVERLMLNDPRTKDCDNWLVVSYLKERGVDINLNYLQCKHLPSFESITRPRRKLQETKDKDLQSSPEVQEKREKAENKFTKKYGRNPEEQNFGMRANSQLS